MQEIQIACDVKDHLPLESLTAFQGNLKTLLKDRYEKLKKEIIETGFAFPVYVWRDANSQARIIGGHQRVRTLTRMKDEGWSIPDVPVVFIKARSHKEAKRRVLQDVAQYGEVDKQGLYEFMTEAEIEMDDLEESFSIPQIELDMGSFRDEYFGEPAESGSGDELLEVPSNPVTTLGDIWTLGNHRLMCGDSTSLVDATRLIDGLTVDLLLTDPPYGVSVVDDRGQIGRAKLTKQGTYRPIIGDETTDTARKSYELALELEIKNMILWGGNYYSDFLPPRAGWVVWDKRGEMASNNFADCELAWTSLSTPARIYRQVWRGMIKEGESGSRVHPTQKPVQLSQWCLSDLFPKANRILDLFGGSGSTLIACEKSGRQCLMMELDPGYCDVILERWTQTTGQNPTRHDGALWRTVGPALG